MPEKKISKAALYWKLFSSTFILSAFTVGGGYVIVPLMRKTFVEKLHWIEENEMMDLIAIAQSAPGPIAVNTSILVGYKIAHVPGALITLLGTILPPLIILTLLSYVYGAIKDNRIVKTLFFGMGIGVAVVILDAVTSMATTIIGTKKILPIILMILAFIATYILKWNIVIIIISCAIIGIIATMLPLVCKKNPPKEGGNR
ncbi:MAG: chromate transporter [Sphaerochaetaceae bacterium]|jgi:chromate transporter|nr:chromate transporter [Sphaerochaetaceae bacterium]